MFAEFYVQGCSATEAARKAGYSETYSSHRSDELLRNVEISKYIRELSDKIKDRRILSAKDRQVMLSEIAGDEEQKAGDRVKAIDTLNKMTGEYTVRVDTTVTASEKLADVFRQLGGSGLDE